MKNIYTSVPGLARPVTRVASAHTTTSIPASAEYAKIQSAVLAGPFEPRSPRAPGPDRERARCTRFARTPAKASAVAHVNTQRTRARVPAVGESVEEREIREERRVTRVARTKKAMAVANCARERTAGAIVRAYERLLTVRES